MSAPLDLTGRPEKAAHHDWETDPRGFGECLRAWAQYHNWTREQAAAELRAPATTYHGWCAGRGAASEAMARRLMTMIDAGTGPRLSDDDGPTG